MLRAVEETSRWTWPRSPPSEHTTELGRTWLPKTYSREPVDEIFEQPCCRIGNLAEKGIAHQQTVSRHLKDLV